MREAFKKTVVPGTLDGGKLYVEIDWDGKRLSICGTSRRSCGQIDFDPKKVICTPPYSIGLVMRLKEVWDRWHLNDMRAGCQHQSAEGWGTKELELVTYTAPDRHPGTYPGLGSLERPLKGWMSFSSFTPAGTVDKRTRVVSAGGSNWSRERYWAVIDAVYRTHVKEPKKLDDPRLLFFAETFGCQKQVERKTDGWVYQKDHPEGKLARPCPVCDHKYGSSWLHEDVPEDVLEFLFTLPEITTGGKSSHEIEGEEFLARNGIIFKAVHKGDKCPLWCDGEEHVHGDRYLVTFKRYGERTGYSLSFWNSMNDAQNGKAPTAYDVIAAITKSDPGTFRDFCGDFGYDEDSRKAEKTYNLVMREWEAVERFFSGEELEEMRDIN